MCKLCTYNGRGGHPVGALVEVVRDGIGYDGAGPPVLVHVDVVWRKEEERRVVVHADHLDVKGVGRVGTLVLALVRDLEGQLQVITCCIIKAQLVVVGSGTT
ncbi:hypothetical protein DPMN_121334 [Dreissena polymorpha]|uniref:Uncharacterized protein n=1 Tax=Dreissena polymorpha TaxID=45954 RepID=A0A9D4GM85_DREPO|nr:hypothetical protein DPMN_121334 [Dreissena polymorpha]